MPSTEPAKKIGRGGGTLTWSVSFDFDSPRETVKPRYASADRHTVQAVRRRSGAAAVACALIALAIGASAREAMASRQSTWCQGSQTWNSVRDSLGVPIRVKARIASVTYARSSWGRPTFLNLGNPYPSRSRVTLVIWGRDRGNFPQAPERMFKRGQVVCAQGMATIYRGAPQIEVGLWDAESRLLSF